MAQALRVCPGLVVVPTRHNAYRAMSKRVMERLYALTPLVEQISIDEAFLDVTARPEDAADLAYALQATIRQSLGLPCSLGVATNKLVAKIANTVGKAAAKGAGPPNAVTVAPPGEEAAFLAPLPCDALWGVGPKTAMRLQEMGIITIGDLAGKQPQDLEMIFGKSGRDLVLRARGLDDRPLETEHEPKSVSQETTFVRDVADEAELLATLRTLADGVSRDLRRNGLGAITVKLKLRWPDFTTPTRQLTLTQPMDDGDTIYAAARRLFTRLWQPGQRVHDQVTNLPSYQSTSLNPASRTTLPARHRSPRLGDVEFDVLAGRLDRNGAVGQVQLAGALEKAAAFVRDPAQNGQLNFQRHRLPEAHVQFGRHAPDGFAILDHDRPADALIHHRSDHAAVHPAWIALTPIVGREASQE